MYVGNEKLMLSLFTSHRLEGTQSVLVALVGHTRL